MTAGGDYVTPCCHCVVTIKGLCHVVLVNMQRLTVVDDALVQQPLHDADGCVSIRRLLVVQQPVDQLSAHEAVGVSPQVVAPVLDHLPLVEPQPGGHHRGTEEDR